VMTSLPAWIWTVWRPRAVLANLRMVKPLWCSINRGTAKAAKTMVSSGDPAGESLEGPEGREAQPH
jgi:hypothetical protein